ncbi:MAG: polyprenol monophosphomannose synthase [Bacteroidia bacterium]
MPEKLVIIPTYKERENIEKMLLAVMALEGNFHVLVVDDNSPDGTADIVKACMRDFPERMFILERATKDGLGRAYISGFHWALDKGYAYIFEMDADFSHNPKDLISLYNTCVAGADMSIGSRYVNGVNVVNWPMGRVLMSYFASVYVRFITGLKIQDTTAGFVCYRYKVLDKIPLDKIRFKGYAFQIEMKFTAWKYGFKLVEVPIIFTDRSEGESKMSRGIFKEALFGVMQIKMKSWFRKYT